MDFQLKGMLKFKFIKSIGGLFFSFFPLSFYNEMYRKKKERATSKTLYIRNKHLTNDQKEPA